VGPQKKTNRIPKNMRNTRWTPPSALVKRSRMSKNAMTKTMNKLAPVSKQHIVASAWRKTVNCTAWNGWRRKAKRQVLRKLPAPGGHSSGGWHVEGYRH
jgi:hypothetical protein